MLKIFIMSLLVTIISLAQAATLKEVGKLEYDKTHNVFIFYFLKNNQPQSVLIHPSSKIEKENLLKQNGKSIILEGEVRTISKTGENFVYREELDNPKTKELSAELLKIDTKKIMEQRALLSFEKNKKSKFKVVANKPTFEVGDQTANSVIAVAGALVGIATGPLAIIPAAAYLINEGVTK